MADPTTAMIVPVGTRPSKNGFLVAAFAIPIVLLGITAGWAYFRSGSWVLVLPYLSGERLLVEPTTVRLGEQKPGTVAEFQVRVLNATPGDVRLLGAQKTCSCITVDDLPLLIPAGHSLELQFQVHIASTTGVMRHSVKFFTDYPDLRTFPVTIQASVH
ncbi:MAG TPA: hypothetical protein VMR25_02885 [Planctomycetaceae bacterium]|jgi:hypothetical protein|nr:hypothetical protein [Planctomycetaceae bacterium]